MLFMYHYCYRVAGFILMSKKFKLSQRKFYKWISNRGVRITSNTGSFRRFFGFWEKSWKKSLTIFPHPKKIVKKSSTIFLPIKNRPKNQYTIFSQILWFFSMIIFLPIFWMLLGRKCTFPPKIVGIFAFLTISGTEMAENATVSNNI